MHKIYLDNASTSFPKPPSVAKEVYNFLAHNAVNINRGSYNNAYSIEEIVFETIEKKLDYYGLCVEFDNDTIFDNIQMDDIDVLDISMDIEYEIEKQFNIKIELLGRDVDKIKTVQAMIDIFHERGNK